MKKIFLIFMLFISFCSAIEKKDNNISFYGIMEKGSVFSMFALAKISISSWLEKVTLSSEKEIKVKFFNSPDELYKEFKNGNLDNITIDTNFFFRNEKEIKSYTNYLWTVSMSDKTFNQYYLVGVKSKNLKGFSDLENKTLSIKKNDLSAKVWLNKNSYMQNHKNSNKLLMNTNYEKKENKILLNVFFGKSDYGVITKEIWDFATVFNPSIKNKVEIIEKSEKIFLPFIGVISKHDNKKNIKILHNLASELKKFNDIINQDKSSRINSIMKLDNNSLKELRNYYNEYFLLSNKYK